MSDLATSRVHVSPASESPDGDHGAGVAAPEREIRSASPLDGLAAKLARIRNELTIDLKVPHWKEAVGFDVFVRYTPLSPSYAARVSDEYRRKGAPDWEVQANARMLVECCKGVYMVDENGAELSMRLGDPDGPWTKFDHDLAETLGLPASPQDGGSAMAVCRKLYFTDGDLIVAGGLLGTWSAQGEEKEITGL